LPECRDSGSCQNAGTIDNYYFTQPLQFSGPSVGVVAAPGGTLTFPGGIVVPNDVLVMMPGGPCCGQLNASDLVVTRFTAPNAGVFDITGTFTDLQGSSVNLTILIME
jgi:hypothetical protein